MQSSGHQIDFSTANTDIVASTVTRPRVPRNQTRMTYSWKHLTRNGTATEQYIALKNIYNWFLSISYTKKN